MKVRTAVIAATIAALSVAMAGQARADPPLLMLSPHQATYSMALATTRLSGGVTGAQGSMFYKFGDSCDGWTVENRTDLSFSYGEDSPVATKWEFVTWESKDGLRYRFRVRTSRNGDVTEEIDGEASLFGHGKGGIAKYTRPEAKTIRLPAGTLFPTEHTMTLIEAARRGEHQVGRVVFDGSDDEGAYDVYALVGHSRPANSPLSPALAAVPSIATLLLTAPSWPMDIAFYSLRSKDSMPDYEVGMRYYQNGVADDIVQSFGDFSLRGTLTKLEPLPKPAC
jgi:hypothetical protein